MLADTTNGDILFPTVTSFGAAASGSMRRIDPVLSAPLQDRMLGNDIAQVDDPDLVGQLLDFDDAAGAIGNAVIVAADRDHAVVADPALQLQNRIEAPCWERLQLRLLGGKGFDNDPLRRAVNTDVSDGIEPVDQLDIEIFQCQTAFKRDPRSASKRDPLFR